MNQDNTGIYSLYTEGLFDRAKATAAGMGGAIKGAGTRLAAGAQGAVAGLTGNVAAAQAAGQKGAAGKQMAQDAKTQSIVNTHSQKIKKAINDYTGDLVKLKVMEPKAATDLTNKFTQSALSYANATRITGTPTAATATAPTVPPVLKPAATSVPTAAAKKIVPKTPTKPTAPIPVTTAATPSVPAPVAAVPGTSVTSPTTAPAGAAPAASAPAKPASVKTKGPSAASASKTTASMHSLPQKDKIKALLLNPVRSPATKLPSGEMKQLMSAAKFVAGKYHADKGQPGKGSVQDGIDLLKSEKDLSSYDKPLEDLKQQILNSTGLNADELTEILSDPAVQKKLGESTNSFKNYFAF